MLKSCPACEHPEREAIEEALARGEPYKTLTKQFKVPIGQLKRHRKAHLEEREDAHPDGGNLANNHATYRRSQGWQKAWLPDR